MKKTLAKAIMLSVLTMAVTSGIAYAEQDTVLGHSHKNEKMEFTNGNITENGITLICIMLLVRLFMVILINVVSR